MGLILGHKITIRKLVYFIADRCTGAIKVDHGLSMSASHKRSLFDLTVVRQVGNSRHTATQLDKLYNKF